MDSETPCNSPLHPPFALQRYSLPNETFQSWFSVRLAKLADIYQAWGH